MSNREYVYITKRWVGPDEDIIGIISRWADIHWITTLTLCCYAKVCGPPLSPGSKQSCSCARLLQRNGDQGSHLHRPAWLQLWADILWRPAGSDTPFLCQLGCNIRWGECTIYVYAVSVLQLMFLSLISLQPCQSIWVRCTVLPWAEGHTHSKK